MSEAVFLPFLLSFPLSLSYYLYEQGENFKQKRNKNNRHKGKPKFASCPHGIAKDFENINSVQMGIE